MEKFRLLRADEIECRVGTVKDGAGVSLLLYKDARCDMAILDETVGPEQWQRRHELINGNLFCSVGIWSDTRGEWVWKQDVGVESRTEAEKGQASDAFKRACVNWGIGRELYTSPFIWIAAADARLNGKYPGERFSVTDIDYDGRSIRNVTIKLEKAGKLMTFGERTKAPAVPRNPITPQHQALIKSLTEKGVFSMDDILKRYSVTHISELTDEQAQNIILAVNDAIAKKKKAKEETA